VIDEDRIAAIVRAIGPAADSFLLTAHVDADAISAQHARLRPTTLQLVDQVSHGELRRLRSQLPRDVRLVQVIHVLDDAAVDEALGVAPLVDALLLDSGNPRLAVKQLGGTGRTHDWATSRRIRDAVPIPVWLAGGLHAGNVRAALAAVRPHGLDVCNGVRRHGALDPHRLRAFAAAAGVAQRRVQ
jgi:phosphoribosylanthranilate isomerase